MDVTEYISGERLQELADHTIVFKDQTHLELAMTQLKNTNCKYTIIEKDEINNDILQAKSLFVYTHGVHLFFNRIFPQLKQPITLVSHNSDYHITSDYAKYLDYEGLLKWYAQNAPYEHKKLIPIPIGIANSQWEHGNIILINQIREQIYSKKTIVYKNFSIATAPENRYHIDILTSKNGIPMNMPKKNKEYLIEIAEALCCICPFGAGMDSHRIWEALYLNTVPVVPDCSMFRSFNELPMIYVKDWNTITPKYLEQEYQRLATLKYNSEKLRLSYWKKEIKK